MLMLMQMQCNYGAKHLRCYSHPRHWKLKVFYGLSIKGRELCDPMFEYKDNLTMLDI
jgi:hypothetical protein